MGARPRPRPQQPSQDVFERDDLGPVTAEERLDLFAWLDSPPSFEPDAILAWAYAHAPRYVLSDEQVAENRRAIERGRTSVPVPSGRFS